MNQYFIFENKRPQTVFRCKPDLNFIIILPITENPSLFDVEITYTQRYLYIILIITILIR